MLIQANTRDSVIFHVHRDKYFMLWEAGVRVVISLRVTPPSRPHSRVVRSVLSYRLPEDDVLLYMHDLKSHRRLLQSQPPTSGRLRPRSRT